MTSVGSFASRPQAEKGRNYGAFLNLCFRPNSLGEAFSVAVVEAKRLYKKAADGPTNRVCVPR